MRTSQAEAETQMLNNGIVAIVIVGVLIGLVVVIRRKRNTQK